MNNITNINIPNNHKKIVLLNSSRICKQINCRFPNDIDEITIYDFNNFSILPVNLKIININGYYNFENKNIIKLLPRKLEQITFDYLCHYNIKFSSGDLPSTLKVLNLGSYYNKTINKNNLPNGLKSLKIGFGYDKPIEDLPDSIEYLYLESNTKIINLPLNLKQININYGYKYRISFRLLNLFSKFKIVEI